MRRPRLVETELQYGGSAGPLRNLFRPYGLAMAPPRDTLDLSAGCGHTGPWWNGSSKECSPSGCLVHGASGYLVSKTVEAEVEAIAAVARALPRMTPQAEPQG